MSWFCKLFNSSVSSESSFITKMMDKLWIRHTLISVLHQDKHRWLIVINYHGASMVWFYHYLSFKSNGKHFILHNVCTGARFWAYIKTNNLKCYPVNTSHWAWWIRHGYFNLRVKKMWGLLVYILCISKRLKSTF